MAVVRISDDLKNGVLANAKRLFDSQLDAAQKAAPDIVDQVLALVYTDILPHAKAMPKEMFEWADNASVTITNNGRNALIHKRPTNIKFPKFQSSVKLSDGVHLSPYGGAAITLPDTPKYESYIKQMREWDDHVRNIEKQRDEFVDGVKKVLNAHATLAPALKAWPPLWDLVPEEYKNRHRKVVERTKPEATIAPDVDLNKLTSLVVASKLGGR
jgi:hypothetical protein